MSLLSAFFLSLIATGAGGDGWAPLFNGHDLEGWVQRGGEARYRVEEGAIVGTTVPDTPNSFLCTERSYRDFILEVDFRIDPELNSGIQIRSESRPDYRQGRVHGYQVEIDPDVGRGRLWTGGIYDEGRRGWLRSLEENLPARRAFRPEAWNRLRILAVGDRIRTWVNGVPAADLRDDMTREGFIALQVHGVGDRRDPLEVHWRRLLLRDLGQHPDPPPLLAASHPPPPPAATVLLGSDADLGAWRSVRGPEAPAPWKRDGDGVEVVPGSGGIETRERFRDFRLHLEFQLPRTPESWTGQKKGNSGVYLQARYEVQILDSGGRPPQANECGALYGQAPPVVNAALAAGEWQSYDVFFTAARWDGDRRTSRARVTVYQNGLLIHEAVELAGPTGLGRAEKPSPGPILLQDHGNTVRFRNIWIVPEKGD